MSYRLMKISGVTLNEMFGLFFLAASFVIAVLNIIKEDLLMMVKDMYRHLLVNNFVIHLYSDHITLNFTGLLTFGNSVNVIHTISMSVRVRVPFQSFGMTVKQSGKAMEIPTVLLISIHN